MNLVQEYGIYLALLVALAIPLSAYITRVMAGEKTVLSRVIDPVERVIYRCLRINPQEDMGWKRYVGVVVVCSAVCVVGLFGMLLAQGFLPLNPQGLPGLSWDLALNTAVSFVTNTNWQAYNGEAALSYFSQAFGLTVQNFVAPAVGLSVLFVLLRGLVAEEGTGLGNFFVDVTRAIFFIFIPLALVVTMINVWQGSPQNLNEYASAQLLEPVGVTAQGAVVGAHDPAAVKVVDKAALPLGPQASQVAIKQLGTNGGGFNGANGASALENPTPLTNLVQCVSILLIPVASVLSFGRMVMDRRQGRALFVALFVLLLVALVAITAFEHRGTAQLAAHGQVYMGSVGQSGGNMEGKETRFGISDSSLWTTFTTAASNGSVNATPDSLTPLGSLVPLVLMSLGEVVFGGVGSGLYGLLGFVILTVFIAGLMVGRTPEYLGKKIGPAQMRMAVILCIITPLIILCGTLTLCLNPQTITSLTNTGAHGFSEVFYAATSTGANNGSAFAGFNANTPFSNVVLSIEMLLGRFVPIVAVCALAGGLAVRPHVATGAATLSTRSILFVFLVIVMVLLVGALTLFPALALGPIADHLTSLGY